MQPLAEHRHHIPLFTTDYMIADMLTKAICLWLKTVYSFIRLRIMPRCHAKLARSVKSTYYGGPCAPYDGISVLRLLDV